MRVALDTNLIAYIEGVNGPERQLQARAALRVHADDELIVPAQVLAELFSVLTRKTALGPEPAKGRVLDWAANLAVVDMSRDVLADAMELVARHKIGWWDAIVVSSAASAECELLLTEDMQHGFTWRGVTVRDPFRSL